MGYGRGGREEVSIGDIAGVTGLTVDKVELFLYLSRNLAEALPGVLQTNNRGELLVSLFLSSAEKRGFSIDICIPQAIIRAIEEHPHPDLPLEIRTDSQYSISCELCRVHSPCKPALSTITNTRPWITRHDPVPPQMATEQFCHIDRRTCQESGPAHPPLGAYEPHGDDPDQAEARQGACRA